MFSDNAFCTIVEVQREILSFKVAKVNENKRNSEQMKNREREREEWSGKSRESRKDMQRNSIKREE